MTNITDKEATVLKALFNEHEGTLDFGAMVYLDNAIDTTDKTTRGVLGSLEKKGLYAPEDGYAWGIITTAGLEVAKTL